MCFPSVDLFDDTGPGSADTGGKQDKAARERASYTARKCDMEETWENIDQTDLPSVKMAADYHYWRGNYSTARDLYGRAVDMGPAGAVTVKRDLLEGLARAEHSVGTRRLRHAIPTS